MALAPEKPAALTVSDRWDGRVATVTVRGEIDISTAGILSDRLDDLASQDPERLVIDLAEVGFMDSSGVQAMLGVRTALPGDRVVVIRSPPRQARDVFTLTGLSSQFIFE